MYQYVHSKKKINKSIAEDIRDLQNSSQTSYIILNKDFIEIKNAFNSFGSVWEKTSYKLVDTYLIVNFLKGSLNFIFTRTEFNNMDYDFLIDHLKQHSKKTE